MGARGLGPIKERILGSVSHRVLTSAPCAKLIVNGPMRALRQVLLPLAGTVDTEEAIRFLQSNPFREPVDLTLLTALPSVRPPWPVAAATAATLEQRELETRGSSWNIPPLAFMHSAIRRGVRS